MSSSLRLISAHKGQIVKITSTLGDSTQDPKRYWPTTAVFDTISSNVDGVGLGKNVREAIQMGLEKKHHVCCSCTGDCATNPECECLKMAMSMKEFLDADVILHGEYIHNPVSDHKEIYYDKPRFVCGPRCSCNEKCVLNAIQDIDKNHSNKFKVSRLDNKGFGMYSKKAISAGSPIFEFNGEISGKAAVQRNKNADQYSLQMIAHDDPVSEKFLDNCSTISEEYKTVLKGAFSTETYVNPLKKGNAARFANHSCDANMEILRVFQGGLSPADLRVVLIATKNIKVGEELTWNYGPKYVKEHLKNKCLCQQCVDKKNASLEEKKVARKRKAEVNKSQDVKSSQSKRSNK